MTVSILHISDLHRDPGNAISNEALVVSLQRDCDRYATGSVPIRTPDIVVVSGDVVYGVGKDSPAAAAELQRQYDEALDLIDRLSTVFLGGRREQLVIVPGNHDISSTETHAALSDLQPHPNAGSDDLRQLVRAHQRDDSNFRWSWERLQFLKVDVEAYKSRLAPFAKFYSDFYGSRSYSLEPGEQVDLFDYEAVGVSFAAFSSCFNNDPLNRAGRINSDCIARMTQRLRHSRYRNRLLCAVWHHSTSAPPGHEDFMHPDILQALIDQGFVLGFHGHQHKSERISLSHKFGTDNHIVVISAGSLCAGWSSVPPGHRRSYNIVELDRESRQGKLHVRVMANDDLSLPTWGAYRFLSGRDYETIQFSPPNHGSDITPGDELLVVEAQDRVAAGDYAGAAQILSPLWKGNEMARRLLLDCRVALHDSKGVIEIVPDVQSVSEAIHLIDALSAEGRNADLMKVIESPFVASSVDRSLREIAEKHRARMAR